MKKPALIPLAAAQGRPGRSRSGIIAWVAAVSCWFLLVASVTAAPTPNGTSFNLADESLVNYRQTRFNVGPEACRLVVLRSDALNSIVSASVVTASAEAPEYCVVHGLISPEVQYIAYFPMRWNGRLYMHGNGGFAGESLDDPVGHAARLKAVRHGFAAAFTNTGHDARIEPGAIWGYRNPMKEIDFGFRALHLTTQAVKGLIQQFYGHAAEYAYFDGCSTGGLQGFMEAQRFPEDFDGILAGAPVFNMSSMMWQYRENHLAIAETPISREKLRLLGQRLLELFDAQDGVVDGVIGDPLAVDFVPSRDLPQSTLESEGFTQAELAVLDIIYSPTIIAGKEVYPRTVVSGEIPGQAYAEGTYSEVAPRSAWEGRIVPDAEGSLGQPFLLDSWFRNLAFEVDDQERRWQDLDPVEGLSHGARASRIFDATDTDLEAFRARGGKMMVYHGWADFGINPMRTVEYFEALEERFGDGTSGFARLYLIPGMQHCAGGNNVDRFDFMSPLIDWVEQGSQPRRLTGWRMDQDVVSRTRPLCPYPEVARYRGTGDPDHHESFVCSISP